MKFPLFKCPEVVPKSYHAQLAVQVRKEEIEKRATGISPVVHRLNNDLLPSKQNAAGSSPAGRATPFDAIAVT